MTQRTQETFLGLDIGTSSVKALLVDADHRVVAEASAPLSVSRPQPLWSEQDPANWVEGVEAAVAAIRRHAPVEFAALSGIGLSGQMHGATLLDSHDKPLRPAILWNDGRSFAECPGAQAARPRSGEADGQPRHAGLHGAQDAVGRRPRARDRQDNEAGAVAQGLCAPAPLRRSRLGDVRRLRNAVARRRTAALGRRTARSDGPDRGRDAATGRRLGGLGRLSPDVAQAWGLEGRTIPIAGGGGDNAASAIGVGATAPGAGFVSLGTSGVIFSVTDRFVSLPERTLHAFCHALPHRWHGMAVMLSAASSLSWIAGVLGRGGDIGELIAGAAAFAQSKSAVKSAPIFLPYLSGERTPHNDAEATGMFAGLRAEHGADAVVFAVMEGVAFSFADGVDVLDAAGARPVRPLLVGGGARSEFWAQTIADVTGLTIDLAQGAEAGAALGAARLGMLAAGVGSIEAVCTRPPVQREFDPDPSRAAMHAPRLMRYRALYQAERVARESR